ncbi:MAG: tRNA lysidine(34) synthetase TilS [Chitinophagaceae bacterium]|nr:tRNA lysidine(34) synthetase TilS [Chitinophagaceae bacterium]
MSLHNLFGRHWQQHFQPVTSVAHPLLVGVSGGIDSVVLVHLLKSHAIPFHIAHVNYQLRGTESNRDESFVRGLATQFSVPIHVQQYDTTAIATDLKMSVQEAARKLRYDWFQNIAESSYIATAHHANDNAETALMFFLRGTGIEGLRGIAQKDKMRKIIRPLLPFTREQIQAYAEEHHIDYVEDSSNAKNNYTRNLLRNIILPEVEKVFPKTIQNIIHNIERFEDIHHLYQEAVTKRLKKLITVKGEELHIPVLKWQQEKQLSTITWEIIKEYGFSAAQVPEVIKLLDSVNGSNIKTGTHILFKNRLWMVMAPLNSGAITQILIDTPGTINVEGRSITIQQLYNKPDSLQKENIEYLDAKHIQFPLILRKYKTGDYFYPLGMTKKKKISRFLIDLKLSITEKEKVWVLESDKKIIAVLGLRIDNRFKIEPQTKSILAITLRNSY